MADDNVTMANAKTTKGSRKACDIAQSPQRNNKEAAEAVAVTPNTNADREQCSNKRQRGQDTRSFLSSLPSGRKGATSAGATTAEAKQSQNKEGKKEETK